MTNGEGGAPLNQEMLPPGISHPAVPLSIFIIGTASWSRRPSFTLSDSSPFVRPYQIATFSFLQVVPVKVPLRLANEAVNNPLW